jgi:integrase
MPQRKKRAVNEGSIRKRADGKWEARLTYYDRPKRTQRSFYGQTQSEARQKMKAAQKLLDDGASIAPEKQTVAQYLQEWLGTHLEPKVRPKTYRSYKQTVEQHLIPDLGKHKLQKMTSQHVQSYITRKLQSGLSTRTVQYHMEVLRNALNRAVKWQLLTRNVVTLVDLPRPQDKQFHWFTPQEARQFLDAVQGDRLEALYTVAVSLGLRQGEILGLRWQDVDLESGILEVRNQLQRLEGSLTLVPLKTDRSRRTVPLPRFAVDTLRKHRVLQQTEQLAARNWSNDLDLVFTTPLGTPIDARNLVRQFERHLKTAGLPRIRFHDLRHTAANLLHAQGVEPRTIMQTLGHSQISLTMNTYSRVIPALQQDAADRMDALLGYGD